MSYADVGGVNVSTWHYIDGARVPSPDSFPVLSPIDQREIAQVASGTAAEVSLAVSAAEAAFDDWAALGARGRAEYLYRLADLIDANVESLAIVECEDAGMMLRPLRAYVAAFGAVNFRAFADMALAQTETGWSYNGSKVRVQRMPAGPVGIITSWNAPIVISTWKLAPALAAGCTVVLKPSEWAPLTCSMIADLAGEAGIPAGVLNVVQGLGREVGEALAADERLTRLSFTGSSRTGRAVGQTAANNMVPCTIEAGGKSPLVVFADADLDAAAKTAAFQYDDAGQMCIAGSRLLVEESVAAEFLTLLGKHTDAHVVGNPRDPETTVPPLIHPDHLARVSGFVERAVAQGDTLLRGGRSLGGLLYEPTLIKPRSNDAEIVQEEVFGPVLTIQTFSDEDEAVRLANSTRYGLAGMVFTRSADRAERVGRAIRSGIVWVNAFNLRDASAPFGGRGMSGVGREGGQYALDFYSDLKALYIKEDTTYED